MGGRVPPEPAAPAADAALTAAQVFDYVTGGSASWAERRYAEAQRAAGGRRRGPGPSRRWSGPRLQLTTTLPKDLVRRLQRAALRRNLSLDALLERVLRGALRP